MNVARQKAAETAAAYEQGNIASLDDSMTRRLVASVVLTESRGGDLEVTNRLGYVGRYQVGASWLAEAGLIDRDKLKQTMGDVRSEKDWARAGEMTKFLEDPGNWNNGLNLEKYKASAELQDAAFKTNCDKAYQRAVDSVVLNADDAPTRVAGFLKAQQIFGYGSAVSAVTGGRVHRDGSGLSNYDCMHDLTRNRDGLNEYLERSLQSPVVSEMRPGRAQQGVLLSNPEHPEHRLYQQALGHLERLGPDAGFKSHADLERAAAAMTASAKTAGLTQIDHVGRSTGDGGLIFAVQGADPSAFDAKRVAIDYNQALAQTLDRSTQIANSTIVEESEKPEQRQDPHNRVL